MRLVPGWVRSLVAVSGGLLLPVLGGGTLGAQDLGTDCDLQTYTTIRSTAAAPGQRVTWLAEPFMICPDGTRIRSDSAVVYEQTRRAELIGNVFFETETRLLESRLADFYEQENRLYARGDVRFTDRIRDSEIRGDTLTYLGLTDFRNEEQITVSGSRPSAVLRPERESTGPEPPGPYQVIGNRLRFEGERFFWADGEVEVFRDDMEAYADSLAFDQEAGTIFLNREARVLAEGAVMTGERINLNMPDDILQGVTIRDRGRLQTDDLDLVGEEIRIELLDEKIQRLVAVHREPDDPDGSPPRPRAVTEEFTLEGDSIDVVSPDEILETVHAVGRARGESLGRGEAPVPVEVDPEDPDAQAAVLDELLADREGDDDPEPGVRVDRDWLEGDEILATFERVSPAPTPDPDAADPDSVAAPAQDEAEDGPVQYRLVSLEARGNARTLYRSPPETTAEQPEDDEEEAPVPPGEPLWSISYIVAQEILIFMEDGAMDRVEARDQIMGLQLEPDRGAR